MQLPFSQAQFLDVFVKYNEAIRPFQVIVYAAGILCAIAVTSRRFGGRAGVTGRIVFAFLGGLWVWMGAVYHIGFFSRVNPAAILFGGLFIVQGLYLFVAAFGTERPVFNFAGTAANYFGFGLLVYALAVYPAIGAFAGHGYPASPLFGVAPCPTTIFTIGVFMLSGKRIAFMLFVIPFLWSLVGGSAAVLLGILEDVGLPVAGIAGLLSLLLWKKSITAKVAVTGSTAD